MAGLYVCPECEYSSKKYFGLCPQCDDGIGVFEEGLLASKGNCSGVSVSKASPGSFKRVDKNAKSDVVVLHTKFDTFDKILSSESGFIDEQVVCLASQPGIGKSTLLAQISDKNTLYIGTEESYSQINSRFLRVNPTSQIDISSETDIEKIISSIETTKNKLIIIDSLNSINGGMDGYIKSAKNMSRLVKAMKDNKKVGVVVSQVTKSGEVTGMNTILHTVDTVLYLERSKINNNLVLSSNKNRFGEIGSVALFEHSGDGLHEVLDKVADRLSEIGETYALAKFGYRNIEVCVEALVAPSNLMNGLRKAYGVSLPRVIQIVGILSYNSSKIDFSSKDIYVAISNGLSVNDSSMDLAVANSILSSYFKVPNRIEGNLSGEISLNGRIKNSSMPHIKDLIKKYAI